VIDPLDLGSVILVVLIVLFLLALTLGVIAL